MHDHNTFPEAIADLTRKLLELCGVGPETRVLDLACGAGSLAIAAAHLGAREVVGVDTRAELIEIANRRAGDERLAIRFEAMEPDALSFPNGSFDVVCCQLGLSAIRSPLFALLQAKRVLVPEGRLGVISPGSRERLGNLLSFAGFFDVSATSMSGVLHKPAAGSEEAPARLPFELVLATGACSPAKSTGAPETWKNAVRRISADVQELSPEETRARAERRACTLIDVRERSEATEMIPGAHLIPRGRLHDDIARLLPDVMEPIVLYSGRGERSVAGAAMLERAGYRNVFSMEGGLERWKELGFPAQATSR